MMVYKFCDYTHKIELANVQTNDALPINVGALVNMPCVYNHKTNKIEECEYMHTIVEYTIDVVNECVKIYINPNENNI